MSTARAAAQRLTDRSGVALLVLIGGLLLGLAAVSLTIPGVGMFFLSKQMIRSAAEAGTLSGIGVYSAGGSESDAEEAAEITAKLNISGFGGTPTVNSDITVDADNIAVLDLDVSLESLPLALRLINQTGLLTTSAHVKAMRSPAHVMLVLDRSGSMSGTALSDLKTAAKGFVDRFQPDIDKMGLVSFSWDATVDLSLADLNKTSVKNAIDGMNANGGTNIMYGIELGYNELKSSSSAAARILVLFTDGSPNVSRLRFKHRNATPSGGYAALTADAAGHYVNYLETNRWFYSSPMNAHQASPCDFWPAMPACMGGCNSTLSSYEPYQNPDNCLTDYDWVDSQGGSHAVTPGNWADNEDVTTFQELHFGGAIIEAGYAKKAGVRIMVVELASGYSSPLSTFPYNDESEFLKEIANTKDKDETVEWVNEPDESKHTQGQYFTTSESGKLNGLFEEVAGQIIERLTD